MAITSSTALVGVAVGSDDSVLAFDQVETDRRHAEELAPLMEKVISDAGIALTDIEVFVIDVGPGRFTGLRVGIATVVGLAAALDKEVIEVTSLESLALAAQEHANGPVVASIDARRNEVFQQRFDNGGADAPLVGDPQELVEYCEGAVVVGDGADRYDTIYGEKQLPGYAPSAAVMLQVAKGRDSIAPEKIVPLYLRAPDAESNVKTRHTKRAVEKKM